MLDHRPHPAQAGCPAARIRDAVPGGRGAQLRHGRHQLGAERALPGIARLISGAGRAAIGFPLGQTTTAVKEYETVQAIADGAGEIDYVIDIGRAKAGDLDAIGEEMTKIVAICRREGVLSKVIFENCYLDQEEIRSLCGVAAAVRPDFVKTSTGFGPSGATAADVALMKLAVGPEVKVKAAGGIRSWETCQQMLLAGAERIGTSSGLTILAEFRQARAAAQ